MANDTNGLDALVERIISDARSDAEKTLKLAAEQSDDIRRGAEKEAASVRLDGERKRLAAQNAVLERSRTNARLDGRKLMLKKKRELLDAVFDDAYGRFKAMDGDKRRAFLLGLLIREAAGGETVIAAGRDRELICSFMDEVNNALAKASKEPLKLSDEVLEACDGGFMLASEKYDKDCTFSAMLENVRTKYEGEAARLLFENVPYSEE